MKGWEQKTRRVREMFWRLAVGFVILAKGVASETTAFTPVSLPATNLHNLFRVTTNVLSGSAPEDDAGFSEIAALGVETIISVDGIRPDVERAHLYGLRYVHLPIGYDGVSSNRVVQLIKAAQSTAGPIYVHCHHGLHRGPAAVSVICEATAGWNTNQAVAWLQQAGTSYEYHGLYRSALEFRLPSAGMLAAAGELPEVAKTSSLVEAMVAIDQEFDRLKEAQKALWTSMPGEPDLTPGHTATILWEHFRELSRVEDSASRSADYRAQLAVAEDAADNLRSILVHPNGERRERDSAFQTLSRSCSVCHMRYRN